MTMRVPAPICGGIITRRPFSSLPERQPPFEPGQVARQGVVRSRSHISTHDGAGHAELVSGPSASKGAVVITDRDVDSALAYQGSGRDLDLSAIRGIGSTGSPLPPEGFHWVAPTAFQADLITPYLGVERDGNLRPDSSVEKLAKLKPELEAMRDARA